MTKVKYMAFAAILGVVSLFGLSSVEAAGYYESTLYLPPERVVVGASRQYASGTHKISISIDQLISAAPGHQVVSSGETRMHMELWDDGTDRLLKTDESTYATSTCALKNMGNYNKGKRHYLFATMIGPNIYAGIISNQVLMYPKP